MLLKKEAPRIIEGAEKAVVKETSEKLLSAEKKTLDGVASWLGKDAQVITNNAGDKIFLFKDGTKWTAPLDETIS